jgi:hypothetical protein
LLRLILTAPFIWSVSPKTAARLAVNNNDGELFERAAMRASASGVKPSAACTIIACSLPATTTIAPRRKSDIARSADCNVDGSVFTSYSSYFLVF